MPSQAPGGALLIPMPSRETLFITVGMWGSISAMGVSYMPVPSGQGLRQSPLPTVALLRWRSPANSPEPAPEQKIHPLVSIAPSRFGQVNPVHCVFSGIYQYLCACWKAALPLYGGDKAEVLCRLHGFSPHRTLCQACPALSRPAVRASHARSLQSLTLSACLQRRLLKSCAPFIWRR